MATGRDLDRCPACERATGRLRDVIQMNRFNARSVAVEARRCKSCGAILVRARKFGLFGVRTEWMTVTALTEAAGE